MPGPNDDKDFTIKENLKKQRFIEKRNHARSIEAQERQTELNKELSSKQQKEKEYYDMAEQTIKDGQRGYDTWISAMSSILVLQLKFVEAGIPSFVTQGKFIVKEGLRSVGCKLKDLLADKIWTNKGDIPVPGLKGTIEFTDDHKLDEETIEKSLAPAAPGLKLEKEDINQFKAGIVVWLHARGYDPQEVNGVKTGKFVKNTGEELTKADFESLRDDPERGLKPFLSNRFDMTVEHTHSNRP